MLIYILSIDAGGWMTIQLLKWDAMSSMKISYRWRLFYLTSFINIVCCRTRYSEQSSSVFRGIPIHLLVSDWHDLVQRCHTYFIIGSQKYYMHWSGRNTTKLPRYHVCISWLNSKMKRYYENSNWNQVSGEDISDLWSSHVTATSMHLELRYKSNKINLKRTNIVT